MLLGIVVFGAVFLIGLALGTVTRRPLATASLVVAAFVAVLVVQTHEPMAGIAVFALISLVGLVVDSVRETVGILLGR
jgi:O-antigen ligase